MANVNHTNRKHALLSASGATRWINCTPSARLEEKFAESKSSVYAQEGTLAHEFGDLALRLSNKEITKRVYNTEVKKLQKSPLYTDEMEEEVDKYTTYVLEEFNAAKRETPGAVLMVEKRLDYSHIVEGGFGTGDSTIIADRLMHVIDLKYGKGIRVDADENAQLMLYGIGALRATDLLFDIDTIRLTIVQPRLNHISTWDISVLDLIDWAESIVKPKAAMAYVGDGVQKAGSWCKWCKVKPMCATLAAQNVELAKHEFADPYLLTDDQLLDVYKQQPMLVDWVSAVAEYIKNEAIAGKKWKGYKLVEGTARRKWSNEPAIIKTLETKGFNENTYTTTKLNGIGAIEKLVGKSEFGGLLGEYVIKPAGAPILAEEADKRPAMGIEQAVDDFSE